MPFSTAQNAPWDLSKLGKDETDRQTDGRTADRYITLTATLLDAVKVMTTKPETTLENCSVSCNEAGFLRKFLI